MCLPMIERMWSRLSYQRFRSALKFADGGRGLVVGSQARKVNLIKSALGFEIKGWVDENKS